MSQLTRKEIDIQIALGAITNSQELSKHIKKATDPEVLEWALHHKNTMVRVAAAKNSNTPIGVLISAYIFESALTVVDTIYENIESRKKEAKNALAIIKDYPQFSLNLK